MRECDVIIIWRNYRFGFRIKGCTFYTHSLTQNWPHLLHAFHVVDIKCIFWLMKTKIAKERRNGIIENEPTSWNTYEVRKQKHERKRSKNTSRRINVNCTTCCLTWKTHSRTHSFYLFVHFTSFWFLMLWRLSYFSIKISLFYMWLCAHSSCLSCILPIARKMTATEQPNSHNKHITYIDPKLHTNHHATYAFIKQNHRCLRWWWCKHARKKQQQQQQQHVTHHKILTTMEGRNEM